MGGEVHTRRPSHQSSQQRAATGELDQQAECNGVCDERIVVGHGMISLLLVMMRMMIPPLCFALPQQFLFGHFEKKELISATRVFQVNKTEEQLERDIAEFESVNQYGGTSRWHYMHMSWVGWCQLDDVCTCH
jgi:hypothetical protein